MTRPMFLGSDVVQNPDVDQLLVLSRALSKAGVGGGALSMRFGARFVVSTGGVPFDMLGHEHLVEVVDYDAHVDNILCIGPTSPAPLAALHGLVYRAKKEVGAIVQADHLPADHPVRDTAPAVPVGRTHLEGAMAVLEALRGATAVQYGKSAVLLVGRTPEEAARPLAGGSA